LYFFDALLLDGVSLLDMPLERRRRILEEYVALIPGFVSDFGWV
jgi:ATP-dependent DNA ligase